MGNRANSTLFYGIYYEDENEIYENKDIDDCGDIEEIIDDKINLIDSSIGFRVATVCDDFSYFMFVKGIHFHGDWDSPEYIDIDKINSINFKEYDDLINIICIKMGINYKQPKLQMISSYH